MGTKQELEDSVLAERLRKPHFDSPYGLTQLQEYRVSLNQWLNEYRKLLKEIKADAMQSLSEGRLGMFDDALDELVNLQHEIAEELAHEESLLSNDDDYEAEELP